MDVGKSILETSQEEMVMVVGTGTENVGTWRILEWEPEHGGRNEHKKDG